MNLPTASSPTSSPLLLPLLFHLLLLFFIKPTHAALHVAGSTCTVTPLPQTGTTAEPNDVPQILSALSTCGTDGTVVLDGDLFHMGSVMETTSLRNVTIEIRGMLRWSSDIQWYVHWLRNSLPVTYAGRSTAWKLGGDGIRMYGVDGKAVFDGQGQLWYDQNRNQSNQNGRPISLTLWYATNVVIDGIRWTQAQFWHTFVAYSSNITMTNLDMNATSHSQWNTVNTDGIDTWNSHDVYVANWTVTCGDDCISVKGNSSNIHFENVHCYESGCAVIGSMGNPPTTPDYVSDILYSNITCTRSSNAAWIKTYPGTGYVRNVTFLNVVAQDVNQPIYVTPCIYSGVNCDASRIPISDVKWINVTGTARYNVASAIHCSASVPCEGFRFEGFNITTLDGGDGLKYLCSNIVDQADTGIPCTGTCPGNWPQQLDGPR
ncbi:glycoside hydrolase family 28 protein [Xylariomycetidae sp. FL2044]|nr:glycoside hydrolase family 28 protein [Xylariomycetidae sp. FL2044]